MKNFMDKHFMLDSEEAQQLYHEHAAGMPIIDYHCHLIPQQIAENHQFKNMTEVWLGGDHYKWRALRANGVPEEYITGERSDWEKFEKWAETMPYAMRNPLYHWAHLELQRIFGIDTVLKPGTARAIYDACNEKLATPEFRAQGLMRMCNVEAVCTTDDPIDDLRWHKQIAANPFGTQVLPTWRPDNAMAIENPESWNAYIAKLEAASGVGIGSYRALQDALQVRHDYFAEAGCKLSDHGMDTFFADDYTDAEIEKIFAEVRKGQKPTAEKLGKFRSAMMYDFAVLDHSTGWAQQFHIGPLRSNNTRMLERIGRDTGFDSILDERCAVAGNRFFDRLDYAGKLTKSIVYNLNPCDNEVLMTMIYNFNDGTTPGKMQFGSGWWFLDQEVGMTSQMNALSMLGLLSRFVGMLTDSRSFLSYPRHEYFRRILCNLIGEDLRKGKLPRSEMAFLGKMVEDIAYNNAKNYFGF